MDQHKQLHRHELQARPLSPSVQGLGLGGGRSRQGVVEQHHFRGPASLLVMDQRHGKPLKVMATH